MDDYYHLEWTFTPGDYFEQELDLGVEGITISIGDGTAEARVDSTTYEQDASLHKRLHEHLFQAFRGTQLIALKPFELSRPATTRIRPDGKREIYFELSASSAFSVSSVDIVIRKADGIVIDSKAERLAAKRELAERVQKHSSDPHLAAMLNSIDRALTDNANCLVYLYEVRDSLNSKFDGEKNAITALSKFGSQKKDIAYLWKELGRLANHEPIEEGRHRGQMVDSLRPATEEELDLCKSIARKFVVEYLYYLETQP